MNINEFEENPPEEFKFGLDQVSVRLVKEKTLLCNYSINNLDKAVKFIGESISDYDREIFGVINFDVKLRPINMNIVSIGSISQATVYPREFMKSLFLSNASSFMIFHNHPSGEVNPSQSDRRITKRLKAVADLSGIQMIDHIIYGGRGDKYYSFALNEELDVGEKYNNEIFEMYDADFDSVSGIAGKLKNYDKTINYIRKQLKHSCETYNKYVSKQNDTDNTITDSEIKKQQQTLGGIESLMSILNESGVNIDVNPSLMKLKRNPKTYLDEISADNESIYKYEETSEKKKNSIKQIKGYQKSECSRKVKLRSEEIEI